VASVFEIPIFPLSNVVLFPRLRAPLHIFEPRYRQMTEAALAGDRRIGMVAVRPSQVTSIQQDPATYSIGCAGIIEDYELLPDGRYNIVLFGTERFRIRCERPRTPTRLYRIAEVELLEEADDPEDSVEFARQRADLASLFSELLNPLATIGGRSTANQLGARTPTPNSLDKIENAALTHYIASTFNFTTEERQALLEEVGHRARIERLCVLLRFALAGRSAPRVPPSGSLH